MPHRYFTTEVADGQAVLRGADAHHLTRVMRAKLGDTVVLCDGNAVEYTATITGFGADTVEFTVSEGYPSAAEPDVEVTLFVGYPKQGKLEEIIQHGVELGCAHFVPFFSRYCVAAPKKEEQKNERYNRIAFEAAKQCGRGVLPDVALPLPNFGAVCRALEGEGGNAYDLVLLCYECGGAPLRTLLAQAQANRAPDTAKAAPLRIALVTGAEGGFAAEEAQAAEAAGAHCVGLGPRILRCETAPLAALAAVMTLTGNFE
jgi:16S rRNA (uracil1498-N3)-methyltransferase